MTYSKLNVEPHEDCTVRLTQNGNVIILNNDDLDFIVEYIKHSIIDLPKNPEEWHTVKKSLVDSMGYESVEIVNTCFACAYVVENSPTRYFKCNYCPLKWHRGNMQ